MNNGFISASLISRAADMIEFRRAVRLSLDKVGPKQPSLIERMYDQLDAYTQRFENALPRTTDIRIAVICKGEDMVSAREMERKRLFAERRRRHLEMQAEQAAFRLAMSA